MPHSFANLITHVIFSTKDRRPLLTPDLRADLLAYLGGIVRHIHGKLIDSNAPARSCSLPPVSSALAGGGRSTACDQVQLSLWVHETWHRAAFAWQAGYGAFSVSQSNVPAVVKYIRDQEQHHRRITFQEEFITLLRRHRIAYDERYSWE